MSTIDALPSLLPFTNVTWDEPRVGPKDGYIHLPERVAPEQIAEVRKAWQAYIDNPDAGPPVLTGGAKFVPWAAYEPEGVLSEATTLTVTRDPWPIAATALGIANTVLLAALLLVK